MQSSSVAQITVIKCYGGCDFVFSDGSCVTLPRVSVLDIL